MVLPFIRHKAKAYFAAAPDPMFEVDDLVQQSYFGMVAALQTFDPSRAGFLKYLEFFLKSSFSEAARYRTRSQRHDGMHVRVSADQTLIDDSGDTLMEVFPAPDSYENFEHCTYLQQLHETLTTAMVQDLTPVQRDILRRRFYGGETLRHIAEDYSCNAQTIHNREDAALKALRNNRHVNGLEQFVDDRTDFYHGGGLTNFKYTQTSGVEKLILQRERLRNAMRNRDLDEKNGAALTQPLQFVIHCLRLFL